MFSLTTTGACGVSRYEEYAVWYVELWTYVDFDKLIYYPAVLKESLVIIPFTLYRAYVSLILTIDLQSIFTLFA